MEEICREEEIRGIIIIHEMKGNNIMAKEGKGKKEKEREKGSHLHDTRDEWKNDMIMQSHHRYRIT